mgnify:CR=1 FL=1|jgi:FtsZ-binding cell division protein ZapB
MYKDTLTYCNKYQDAISSIFYLYLEIEETRES